MTTPDCPASVLVLDDDYQRTDFCHLPAGHDGDHRSPRTACEPVAYLGWGDDEANDQGAA